MGDFTTSGYFEDNEGWDDSVLFTPEYEDADINEGDLTDIVSLLESAIQVAKALHWNTGKRNEHNLLGDLIELFYENQDAMAETLLSTGYVDTIKIDPSMWDDRFYQITDPNDLIEILIYEISMYVDRCCSTSSDKIYQTKIDGLKSKIDDFVQELLVQKTLARMG